MDLKVITDQQVSNRRYWVDEICRLSGNFGIDSDRVEHEITQEIKTSGTASLIGHLRLCGAIPEQYAHDSTEEKLYSKYTDVVIHEAYTAMGFTSAVLRERADVADVECVCSRFSFVADAKAFRLSRTAKNQKDFKIQALDNWKHGKPFAMVVCPVYQLPARSSQIYQQAATRSVCIFTYTHLAALVRHAEQCDAANSVKLMHEVFKTVDSMIPSKDASAYWQGLNRAILEFDTSIAVMWREEKIAATEAIRLALNQARPHGPLR